MQNFPAGQSIVKCLIRALVLYLFIIPTVLTADNVKKPNVLNAKWVDAAFYHHQRKVTYLFQGNKYIRMTSDVVDKGYPKALPGGWSGLPKSFHSGIDAAVYDPSRDKLFLFKGSQMVRITGTTVDRGYPKPISDDWQGLPGSFYQGIDAAIYRKDKIYFFKKDKYVRLSNRRSRVGYKYQMDENYPAQMPGGWDLGGGFQSNLDAAIFYAPNGKNYFFKGDHYTRLSDTKEDNGYPVKMPGGWKGMKPIEASPVTKSIQIPADIWEYPSLKRTYIQFSNKEEFTQELINSIDDNDIDKSKLAEQISTQLIGAGASGLITANGVVSDLNGLYKHLKDIEKLKDFGGTKFSLGLGVVGLVTGAAVGAIDIVDKVRAENGSSLVFMNTVMDSKVEIVEVDNGFKGELLNVENGQKVKIYQAAQAQANTTSKAYGGILLQLSPQGGLEGSMKIKFTHEGRSFYFDLDLQNRVGAGLKSEYLFTSQQWGSRHLVSNRKEDDFSKTLSHPSGKYGIKLRLKHGKNSRGIRDQTKDVFSVTFFENEEIELPPPSQAVAISPGQAISQFPGFVDAAMYHAGARATYFFQGGSYFKLSGTKVMSNYPQKLPGGWRGLPARFYANIDAAVFDREENKAYLFKGNEVIRLTGFTADRGYPKPISSDWQGLPGSFYTGIDAAIYRKGYIYLFKGKSYVRLSRKKVRNQFVMDSGYPRDLPGGWNLSNGFQSDLDAALDYGDSDKRYFFKESTYTRLSDTRQDSGYPKAMPGEWTGMHIIQDQSVTTSINVWEYPGTRDIQLKISEDQFFKSISESTGDPDLAKKITKNTLSAIGGGATVIGLITSVGGPATPVVAGALGTAIGLAVGTVAIVNKVRIENKTSIVLMNGIENAMLEVYEVSGDFEGKLIDETNQSAIAAHNAIGATATTTKEKTGAIILNFMPSGGRGLTEGNIKIKMEHNGQVHTFNLYVKNRVAAGLESTYTLSGWGSETLTSNRRNDEVEATLKHPTLNYNIHFKLHHADNNFGEKDQRKDLVVISFAPKPE